MDTCKTGNKIIVAEVYAMYLLTGAACVSIGTTLLQLSSYFNIAISHVAILVSTMALGRVSTVFLSSKVTDKFGSKFSLQLGIILIALFCLSITMTRNFAMAAIGAAFGGIGQGLEDSSCPVILKKVFKENYHRAISATQVFFGIGSFLVPLFFSLLLYLGMQWQILYLGLFFIAAIMIIGMLFAKVPEGKEMHFQKEAGLNKEKDRYPRIIILFILLTFTYTAVINTIYTYTAAYNINLGLSESVSVSMLTMFSIGSMIGALIFTAVLKYFKVISVLFFNCIFSYIMFSIIKSTAMISILLPCYFIFGSFFGVVYSLLVSTSTEMMPNHTSFAAAMAAFFSGSADILSPLITGQLVNRSGINMSFRYAAIMGFGMVIFVTMFFLFSRKNERKKQLENLKDI